MYLPLVSLSNLSESSLDILGNLQVIISPARKSVLQGTVILNNCDVNVLYLIAACAKFFVGSEFSDFDTSGSKVPRSITLENALDGISLKVFSDSSDIFGRIILFPKEKDRHVASSILYLCQNKDQIDNFNKKALYIMIREMTDVQTSKITQVSNVFRKIYPRIQQEMLTKGHINNLQITGSI